MPRRPPELPYVSNLTGTWITSEEATDPAYYGRHVREPVRFGTGVQELLKRGNCLPLEIGPGRTLTTLAQLHVVPSGRLETLGSIAHASNGRSDQECMVRSLAQLWVAGVGIDWRGYYASERRRRVTLPTYPFERERFWIEPLKPDIEAPALVRADGKKVDIGDWFYRPLWKQAAPLPPLLSSGEKPHRWLLFVDECGLGEQLAQQLKARGHEVVRVQAGDRFSAIGEQSYVVNPRNAADYGELLQAVGPLDSAPTGIVHLWGVTPEVGTSGRNGLERTQERGFYSVLYLARALAGQTFAAPLRLKVVTNHVHAVTGQEHLCPAKATVVGPCRVIPQEFPNVGCTHIDVIWPDGRSSRQPQLPERFLAELFAEDTHPSVAHRGLHRWVQAFEAAPALGQVVSARMRKKGVYLLTGGLGGIGLALAECLAEAVQAKLILVGRSGLPSKDNWVRWLETHPDDDSVSRKIRKVRTIEQLGAEVLVAQADVSHIEEMEAVVAQAHERFGPIRGVIHAAGVAGGGAISLKSKEAAAAVLAPKVQGTLVLDEVLRDEALDFMLLCSSVTAIIGGFGQVDYCAGNAFLDAFAQYRWSRGDDRVSSVNWDAWQQVGMAVETAVPDDLERRRLQTLQNGITVPEGQEVFGRILGIRLPQVVTYTQDLDALVARSAKAAHASGDVALGEERLTEPQHPRPALSTLYVPPEGRLQRTVCGAFEQALGVKQVGVHDSFFDLGGHSLLAIDLMSRLNRKCSTDIPVAKLYEGLTPAFLADLLRNDRAGRVSTSKALGSERRIRQLRRQEQHQHRRRVSKKAERRPRR